MQSIVSDQFGRLLGVRVRNQNTIIVNLPAVLLRDDDLVLTVVYAGRLEPQREDTEALAAQGGRPASQGPADEHAGVPAGAQLSLQQQELLVSAGDGHRLRDRQPADDGAVEYRLRRERHARCRLPDGGCRHGMPASRARSTCSRPRSRCAIWRSCSAGSRAANRSRCRPVADGSVTLVVQTNPRQARRGRELGERANDILGFYGSLLGDAPYPSFTLAAGRERAAGRPQPRVFRGVEPAAADHALRLAQRSRRRSRTFRSSSSPTRSRTSGGDRRSAGATITSSG